MVLRAVPWAPATVRILDGLGRSARGPRHPHPGPGPRSRGRELHSGIDPIYDDYDLPTFFRNAD